jgi:hypothetical protein
VFPHYQVLQNHKRSDTDTHENETLSCSNTLSSENLSDVATWQSRAFNGRNQKQKNFRANPKQNFSAYFSNSQQTKDKSSSSTATEAVILTHRKQDILWQYAVMLGLRVRMTPRMKWEGEVQ